MACSTHNHHDEIPTFRVKRSHKKSRLGCVTCKRRRVKCDETRPSCERCRYRGLECAYEERAKPTAPSTIVEASGPVRPITSPQSQSSSDGTSPSDPQSWKDYGTAAVPDVELTEHYLAHTVKTFEATGLCDTQSSFWYAVTPSLAYTSSPVRHGMLSLAALCLHFHTDPISEQAERYFHASVIHGNAALKLSGLEIQEMSRSNVDSIFGYARLSVILSFAFFRIRRLTGYTLSDPESWIWLHMLRGVTTIRNAIEKDGTGFNKLISQDLEPSSLCGGKEYFDVGGGSSEYCNHLQLDFVARTREERFEALHSTLQTRTPNLSPERIEDYLETITSLQRITDHVCVGSLQNINCALCNWICNLPNHFVDLLKENDGFALAVYAHWLILVVLGESMWWFDDMGRAGIREIGGMIAKEGGDVDALMEWPKRMLEVNEIGEDADCESEY